MDTSASKSSEYCTFLSGMALVFTPKRQVRRIGWQARQSGQQAQHASAQASRSACKNVGVFEAEWSGVASIVIALTRVNCNQMLASRLTRPSPRHKVNNLATARDLSLVRGKGLSRGLTPFN